MTFDSCEVVPIIFGVDALAFEIGMSNQISGIRLSIDDNQFLHLSEIKLMVGGVWQTLQDCNLKSFKQSSLHLEEERFSVAGWLAGKRSFFSTKRQKNPFVEFYLEGQLDVQGVQIVNRRDGLWWRAEKLKIEVFCGHGWRVIYNGASAESRSTWFSDLWQSSLNDLKALCARRNISDSLDALTAVNDQALFLYRLVSSDEFKVPEYFKNDIFSPKLKKSIICLLCSVSQSFDYQLLRFTILSLITCGFRKDAFNLYCMHINAMSFEQLEQFKVDLSLLGQSIFGYPLIVGAHNFSRPLRSYNRDSLLDTIDELCVFLNDLGCGEAMVCYGTLLGFYRDGDFIAHDDDLDLLFLIEEGKEIVEIASEIVKKLNGSKFWRASVEAMNIPGRRPFIQLVDKRHKVPLDIFVGTYNKLEVSLPMANVKFASLSLSTVLPRRSHSFFNRNFPCPHDIEGFLEARYGSTWSIPDPLFRSREANKLKFDSDIDGDVKFFWCGAQ